MTEVLDPVIYQSADGVAEITLNRPSTLNAVDRPMAQQLNAALNRAAEDPAVVAIILTGAGRGFCSGADMSDLADNAEAPPTDEDGSFALRYGFMTALPKPIIALINGPCAGMGVALAAFSDIRFASSSASVSASFVQRGLTAEMALAWILPRVVGEGAARDMLLSGRKLTADELRTNGFVQQVFESETALAEVRQYAKNIASSCSPFSLAQIKAQLNRCTTQTLAEAEEESVQLMFDSLTKADFKEGVAAFMEKRKPDFLGKDKG